MSLLQFLAIISVDERAQTGTPSLLDLKEASPRALGRRTHHESPFSGLSERHRGERTREKAQPEFRFVFFSPLLESVYGKQRYQGYCHLVLLNRKTKVPIPPPSPPKPAPQGFCCRKLAPSFPADLTDTGNSRMDQRVSMKK